MVDDTRRFWKLDQRRPQPGGNGMKPHLPFPTRSGKHRAISSFEELGRHVSGLAEWIEDEDALVLALPTGNADA